MIKSTHCTSHLRVSHRNWAVTLAVVCVVFLSLIPDLAYAANTPMGKVLCTMVNWLTGNTGKGLATIAITIVGIGALLGKVSWGMAIIVGIGVAIVFGAAGIVNAMNAGATTTCSTT